MILTLLEALLRACQRRRTIHQLAKLNDRQLADIGLTRNDVVGLAVHERFGKR